jgi:hypothetical protein
MVQLQAQGAIHEKACQLMHLPLHGKQSIRRGELELSIDPYQLGMKKMERRLHPPRDRALVTKQPICRLELRTQPQGEVQRIEGLNG